MYYKGNIDGIKDDLITFQNTFMSCDPDQNQRHPIAFASRQTNPTERKYAPTELEVAALIFAIEHFEVYLLGNQFTVYTDHQALAS